MDYRLTDAMTDPPGSDRFYTEKLVRLPHAFFVYSDEPNAWFDPTLPADRNGFFTFGSFNSFTKINDETLDSWATILRGVPNSRLFMKARPLENPSTRERVIRSFAERGVTEDRLTLRAWVSLAEHTTMLGSAIDLMLDTYPYNGHTTSCQAIWRGVPVVTRSGDSFRSRVGECIMRNLDLPDFVGKSKREYEQTAIRIAGDLPALRALRPTLQQRMRQSPLFDAIGFTRSFERALKRMLAESSSKHWIDLALQLHQQGELTKAVEAYQAGLALEPNHLAALNNLGACYLTLGRVDDGIQLLEKAAKLNPTEPRMRNNIGTAFEDLGKFDEAIEQYKAAYAIDPTYAESLNNLGAVYGVSGKHDLAIASYREALRVRPDFPTAHSNLLMSMVQQSEIPEQQVFDEHLNWAAVHTKGLPQRGDFPDSGQHRRLRIGYVSPDFREHSVRRFIEPVLAAHDRSQFEVFCYAVTAKQDAATSRLKSLVETWRFVPGLDDAQLADQIRADGIDILIDLAGHTSEHRLLAFARSPAPVRVTYLGYPATTGLASIQYRLTDSLTDPSGSESFCTEQLVRLPHAFFTYEFDPAAPYEPSLPADRNGYFTFGSFNNFAKINQPMLQSWADILMAVPGSRLILKAKPMGNQSTKDDIVNFFSSHGIDPSRLDLLAWVDSTEHQRLMSSVDLALDPFPYHGHTTSCESVWMGVPFVTRAGNTFRSRVGVTILHHLDLIDFIADSEKQYVEKAIRFASDLTRLRKLRPILRDRMRASTLCDAAGFTRSLEHAYREMWRTECEARLTRR
jgi:predicted O-linked N-acetylglucosamine transferase (SPINDLY family)